MGWPTRLENKRLTIAKHKGWLANFISSRNCYPLWGKCSILSLHSKEHIAIIIITWLKIILDLFLQHEVAHILLQSTCEMSCTTVFQSYFSAFGNVTLRKNVSSKLRTKIMRWFFFQLLCKSVTFFLFLQLTFCELWGDFSKKKCPNMIGSFFKYCNILITITGRRKLNWLTWDYLFTE